ncbi:hypothetical protein [Pendulispora albinea]|uniref:Uncharacterized protein n=1 Tax=Pendulispora albinea TaxID=2741071 RepID=A0ABZ2LXQ5_9BACT
MKKLPRTDVIEKQNAIAAEESNKGKELDPGSLESVQGGAAPFIPMYGVPLPGRRPGGKPRGGKKPRWWPW